MTEYKFGDIDKYSLQQIVELYNSTDFEIVNNLSYRVNNSLLFRRSDYLVPETGDVSAVQSFLQIQDPDDDREVVLKGQYV